MDGPVTAETPVRPPVKVGRDKNHPQLYDSLEAAAQRPAPLPARGQDEAQAARQVATGGVHSGEWRAKLKAVSGFDEEHHPVPGPRPHNRHGAREEVLLKGGYRYVAAAADPAPAESPGVAVDVAEGPFRLHPCHPVTSAAGSPMPPGSRRQRDGSPGPERPSPTRDMVKRGHARSIHGSVPTEGGGDPRQTDAGAKMEIGVYGCEGGQGTRAHDGSSKKDPKSNPKLMSPLPSNKKAEPTRGDIIERNIFTLGRSRRKHGSYLKAHAVKQEKADTLDPVTAISKEKNTQRKGNPDPSPRQGPPARAGAADTPGGRLSPHAAGPSAAAGPDPPDTPSSCQTLASVGDPGAQLSGNPFRSTPSDPQRGPPLLTQRRQSVSPAAAAATLNLPLSASSSDLRFILDHGGSPEASESLRGPSWSRGAGVGSTNSLFTIPPHGEGQESLVPRRSLSPPTGGSKFRHPKHGNPPRGCRDGLIATGQYHRQSIGGRRATAPKWPPPHRRFDQNSQTSPNEVDGYHFPEDAAGPPGGAQHPGSDLVLPPIGKPVTGVEPLPGPGGSGGRSASPVQRSGSDGYLAQMEKQKQLKEGGTYKAYTLRDYKQLKNEVNLRGLGPDYKSCEKTAEKMRRQKLYSNVIREQNKTMSRIPFLPPKDPEDVDKMVPRRKALEYAKNIAKPQVQPHHPKPNRGLEGVVERAPPVEGLDLRQLTALELMRKRHEEEKQAVACFRKVHAV